MTSVSKKARVLLITCTDPSPSSPSLGITSIATHLLSRGVDVRIFDDAPYMLDIADATTDPRELILSVAKTDKSLLYRKPCASRFSDLLAMIDEFKPHIAGAYTTEETFPGAVEYCEKIKAREPAIITVVGGPFAIFSPEIAIREKSIDAVSIGEGELALEEYCRRLMSNDDPCRSRGFWVKGPDGVIHKNPFADLIDINSLAPLRYDLYHEKRLLRPMSGAIRRMLPLEVSRGCVYDCTFCASPELKERYRGYGKWHRMKDVDLIDRDISTYISLYDPEYFFIISETFLAVASSYFDRFVKMYGRYRIPFWMNTRPETIKDEYIGILKEIGLERMSIGVECGNEKYRKEVLNRNYSNESLENVFNICRKHDIKVSANVMIGLPDETREMIFDSIRLIKDLKPVSLGLCIFQPYKGTRLYEYAARKGYVDRSRIVSNSIYEPVMTDSRISPKELKKLLFTFNLYARLDESKWPLIDSIDMETVPGVSLFHDLVKQCSEICVSR